MSHTVIGIFNSATDANNAVQQLLYNGFNDNEVDYSGSQQNYSGTETRDENESGISRFFKNLFGDDDESTRYSRAAQNRHVVTVHAATDEQARRASELLDEYGAIDVDEDDSDYSESNRSSYATDNDKTSDYRFDDSNTENKKIQIIEENLNVGKKVVETGGVRLRSRIIEKPVEETIRLREERVTIDRQKVDRPVTDADINDFEEGTVEVRQHSEIPVVSKDARVVEEISIGKTTDEREETIHDNVRRQDVDVEDIETDNRKNNF